MNLYEKALNIAKEAHKGQKQKDNVTPYIEHPIFVASLVTSEKEKAVALLHDVIEDTNITLEELKKAGLPTDVIEAVSILTKQPKSSYFDYIEKVKTNPLAKKIKLVDLYHNSDITRIPNPSENDYKRFKKYQRAIKFLNDREFTSFREYEDNLK